MAVYVHLELPIVVDETDLIHAVQAVLDAEGHPNEEVTVVLTDDAQIQELNRRYAGVNAPTDVLAFSALEGDPKFVIPPEATGYLGDIVISIPYAARQAAEQGLPLAMELRLLAVHGTLHLLGYDHSTAEEQANMWHRQDLILRALPPLR